MRRLLLTAALWSAGIAAPGSAAITLSGSGTATTAMITSGTTIGDHFTIYFDAEPGGVPPAIAGVTSNLTLYFEGANTVNKTYTFNYLLNNTSTVTSRVSVFGFDVAPDALLGRSSVTDTYGIFNTVEHNQIENQKLEICFDHDGNNCNQSTGAPPNNGVWDKNSPGHSSTTGTIVLGFATNAALPGQIVLSSFLEKYQSIGPQGQSALGTPVPPPPPPVPEPRTWAMMMLGFAAIGFKARRRSRLERITVTEQASGLQ